MPRRPTLGFVRVHGGAIFTCSRCRKQLAVELSRPRIPAEVVAGYARNKGWVASPTRMADCLCPSCKIKPKGQNDADSEIKRLAAKENDMPVAATAPPVVGLRPDPKPTNDQRVAIRNLLDKHFDDSVGSYLDGWSDAKIAGALNIPRIIVERIRDAAYGPLRENPEIRALEAEIVRLAGELDAIKARLRKLASNGEG